MQTPARDLDWDVAEAVRKHGLYLKQHSGGQQADLRQKTLRGTMLAAVDLRGSNLRGVNLADAVLTDTDLTGSDLRSCNLDGADLSGADITACVIATGLARADPEVKRPVVHPFPGIHSGGSKAARTS